LTFELPEVGAQTPRSTPSRHLIFAIVAVAIFMTTMDSTIVATALLSIHDSLHSSINWSGWTITIYSLGMVIAFPTAGRFSDQYGRRRIFLMGIALFTISSFLCGFASDIYILVVFRGFQALGGGAITPSAAGLVADHFGRDRDKAIGMFGTIAATGQIVGPILGGLFVAYLSWRWIFFVNVPLGIAIIILIAKFVPESRTTSGIRVDLRGVLLMAGTILAANFGVTFLGNPHASLFDASFICPELLALVFLYFFIHHERTAESPFIPMRLLKAKGFAVVNFINFLWGIVGFGLASLVPLYAEERYHLVALSAGTLLTARGVGTFLMGIVAALLLRRTGYRLPMIVGYSLVAVGILLISISPMLEMGPYLWLSIGAGLTGLGTGIANPASRNASLQLAPDDVAAISGLRQMFLFIGIIFSVSVISAFLNRSPDPGLTQAHIYWVIVGLIVVVMLPLVMRVPEHKGEW
jgi:EmrB/QacA subfamily drug resistance transporter